MEGCLCESESEMERGLEGEKLTTKREKEGEMNEEGAVRGWVARGMNEQEYSESDAFQGV